MSLEAQLERLNTNLEALIPALAEAAGAGANNAGKAAGDKPASTRRTASSKKDEGDDKPTSTRRTTRGKKSDEPEVDLDKAREVLGAFMKDGDEDERVERKEFVAGLLKKHKAAKLPDLEGNAKALAAIIAAVEAEAEERAESGEEEEDGDLLD